MRKFGSETTDLSGALLLAHPNLQDPNFRRSVLVLANHDPQQGALGFIINRPTDKVVADVLPAETDLGPLARVPLFLGGPVNRDHLVFVALHWIQGRSVFACRPHLSPEEAQEIGKDPTATIRAFIGYAGWTAGQLEAELNQKAWVVRPPEQTVLDPRRSQELWPEMMRSLGPWFRLLAAAPDDPSLN